MKRFSLAGIVLIAVASLALALGATPKKYGKELTLKEVTPIQDILANPEEFNGKRVLVEGKVVDVCSMMGCWIKIVGEEGSEPITFKVDDGVIVFPPESKDKIVRAEGIVSVKEMTEKELIDQARHEAEVNDKLDSFDPSTIKGPKTVVRIMGEGAEMAD